ncbi:MAG: bifunctional biotin--[acetyl-CoA-carboxylase] ligase/biotin operon repressor BirA [Gammaproteobacteria bacterium]|nr:bifunctional biotin--[acetyl-CoA-carboxylase] ligase/biotin operon repressor BirA [Gammaproteobacteria bacterium]
MPLDQTLLKILSNGQFHSGEALGAQLGVTRSAVWKSLQSMQQQGLDIHSVPGRGYKLARPFELLEKNTILEYLDGGSGQLCSGLEIHFEIGSTNRHLMQQARTGLKSGYFCLAEQQLQGRGRRGRDWVSPLGGNIYLSLLWRFAEGPASLAGLSLAAGIAVTRALNVLGITEHGLKWPNDVLWKGKKLAGILLEVAGEATGPCHAVIGIGLNVAMPKEAASAIEQAWVDIESIRPGLGRNRIAAELVHQLLVVLAQFQQSGLSGFVDEWRSLDHFANQEVVLHLPVRKIEGIARSIDEQGSLCLEVEGKVSRYGSGEVSLRGLG